MGKSFFGKSVMSGTKSEAPGRSLGGSLTKSKKKRND